MLFLMESTEDGVAAMLAEDGEIMGRILFDPANGYQLQGYQRITPVGVLIEYDWRDVQQFATFEAAFAHAKELGTKLWMVD